MTQHFQILVVGSGPAGMAAATCAAEHGSRVGLIDDNPDIGGQIWRAQRGRRGPDISHGGGAKQWRDRLDASSVTRLQGWSIFDQPAPHTLRAERQNLAADFTYEQLILATGARERFLPLPGWTLPNVMGVGAIQAMFKGGLPVRGKRIVVAGSGPLLLAVAATLHSAGAIVVCIAEQASMKSLAPFALSLVRDPAKIMQGLRYKASTSGVPFHTCSWPVEAKGEDRVTSVTLSIQGSLKEIPCDYLACGFHLVPNIELPSLLGCRIEHGVVVTDELQRTSVPGIFCAGEPTGIGGLEKSLLEGEIAGLSSVGQQDKARKLIAKRQAASGFAHRLAKAFALRPELSTLSVDDTIVCRCEDVTFGALQSHTSWRAAKLHTRCGMGPCQGRICGAATETLFGWNADSVRPPVLPSLISSLASTEIGFPRGTSITRQDQ
jgi:NADPH-dependent 2,4-dienoyl-CoA reductase/sulfur reductase-like enzyme